MEAFLWMYNEEILRIHNPEIYNGCGILADSMGLGKTLTALALIFSHRPIELKKNKLCDTMTTLVICPTSLIDEWSRELHRQISKSLNPKIYIIHGPDLTLKLKTTPTDEFIEHINGHDIVITNYQTAQSQLDLLKRIKFIRIILDESQNIKNQKSAGFQNLNQLHLSCNRFEYQIHLSYNQ